MFQLPIRVNYRDVVGTSRGDRIQIGKILAATDTFLWASWLVPSPLNPSPLLVFPSSHFSVLFWNRFSRVLFGAGPLLNSLSWKGLNYFQNGFELLIEVMDLKLEQKNKTIIIQMMEMDEAAAASQAA